MSGFEEELLLFEELVDLLFGFLLDDLFWFPLLALGCSLVVAFIFCRIFSTPLNELDLFTPLWDGPPFLSAL